MGGRPQTYFTRHIFLLISVILGVRKHCKLNRRAQEHSTCLSRPAAGRCQTALLPYMPPGRFGLICSLEGITSFQSLASFEKVKLNFLHTKEENHLIPRHCKGWKTAKIFLKTRSKHHKNKPKPTRIYAVKDHYSTLGMPPTLSPALLFTVKVELFLMPEAPPLPCHC